MHREACSGSAHVQKLHIWKPENTQLFFPGSGVTPGEALTAPSSGWLQNVLQVRGDGDKYVTERVSWETTPDKLKSICLYKSSLSDILDTHPKCICACTALLEELIVFPFASWKAGLIIIAWINTQKIVRKDSWDHLCWEGLWSPCSPTLCSAQNVRLMRGLSSQVLTTSVGGHLCKLSGQPMPVSSKPSGAKCFFLPNQNFPYWNLCSLFLVPPPPTPK